MRRFAVTFGLAIIVLIVLAYLLISGVIAVVEGILSLVVFAVIVFVGYLVIKGWSR